MTDNMRCWLRVGPLALALFAFAPEPAAAQRTDWDKSIEAGTKAYRQGRYAEAEKQLQAALKEAEKFAPNDPRLAATLNDLGLLDQAEGKYGQAETLFKRSLATRERVLGLVHPDVAASLNNLAELYRAKGRYDEAEPLYMRSLAIWEKTLGPEHPDVATSLNNLAELYHAETMYSDAEPLYKRSLTIWEKALGRDHPAVADTLENYAELLRTTGRNAEAETLEARAKAIRARQTKK